MKIEHSIAKDDPLLAPLREIKIKLLWLHQAVERFLEEHEGIRRTELMPLEQLEFSVDNMMRILILGSMKAGMEAQFAEVTRNMQGQQVKFQADLLNSLDPHRRQILSDLIESAEVAEGEIYATAGAMIAEDYHMEVLVRADHIAAGRLSAEEQAAATSPPVGIGPNGKVGDAEDS